MSQAILEFDDLTVEGGYPYDAAIWQLSLRLAAGELAIIHLEGQNLRLPLADAAEGLIDPLEGAVRFLGEDWRAMAAPQAMARRARIGRVFDDPGWLSELDVGENITLAQRHHTRRNEAEIRDEAAVLARAFSLPGLPSGFASSSRVQDLRRAACVRALLGSPQLILLERPETGVYPGIMPPLMENLRAARVRGAAVVWLTDSWEVWNDAGIRPTFRFTMSGSQMTPAPGGDVRA